MNCPGKRIISDEEENHNKISNRLEVDASISRLHGLHADSSIIDSLKFCLPLKVDHVYSNGNLSEIEIGKKY